MIEWTAVDIERLKVLLDDGRDFDDICEFFPYCARTDVAAKIRSSLWDKKVLDKAKTINRTYFKALVEKHQACKKYIAADLDISWQMFGRMLKFDKELAGIFNSYQKPKEGKIDIETVSLRNLNRTIDNHIKLNAMRASGEIKERNGLYYKNGRPVSIYQLLGLTPNGV